MLWVWWKVKQAQFQYQKGAIKTGHLAPELVELPRFNTKKVRLKPGVEHVLHVEDVRFNTKKVRLKRGHEIFTLWPPVHVSIPKRCD